MLKIKFKESKGLMMDKIRRHARKIKLAAVLLVILIVCGAVGQLNVQKNLVKVAPDAFVWQEGKYFDLTEAVDIEGKVEIDNSFVTMRLDYQVYGTKTVPNDGNIHIEIQSVNTPDNVLIWEFVPGAMESCGEIQIDLQSFKGQTVNMLFSVEGDFSDDSGVRLENIKLSKMYIGS